MPMLESPCENVLDDDELCDTKKNVSLLSEVPGLTVQRSNESHFSDENWL